MKKFMAISLVLMLSASVLAGCSTGTDAAGNTTPDTTNEQAADNNEVVEEGIVKIGLGTVTAIDKSTDLGENGARAQVDTVLLAAGFDAEGRVASVTIDTAQTRVDYDADMKLTTDINELGQTKVELGDDYGMKRASGIEKEWHEQAAALEEWMVGKTVAEIMAMELEEDRPAEADLVTSATIRVNDYLVAIEKAYNNAVEVEAGAVTVGLATEIKMDKSRSAEGDNGAQAQVDTVIKVAAFDAEGRVAGAIIDTAQTRVAYDVDGNVTTDRAGEFKTKVELGDEYGMKRASGIEKEWHEQAAALEEWMTGKTVAEIKAMEREEDRPAEADLVTSATIRVGSYINTIEKAQTNAK